MSKIVAIVAHFDADDRLDENFKLVLSCLEQVVDKILLVTTSNLDERETVSLRKVSTIRRPNFGYDFYSYRVGIALLRDQPDITEIFLVNSSFLVVDPEIFTNSLKRMLSQSPDIGMVGITKSEQMSWHLQSYLLLIRAQIFRAAWFRQFFDKVQPQNTKLEIILNYEIGFSSAVKARQTTSVAMFKGSFKQRMLAYFRWIRVVAKQNGRLSWITGKPLRHWREVNWTHFCAEEIAAQFGIIKTEVLRTNPHSIPTNFISGLCNPTALKRIETFLDNSKHYYNSDQTGLTTLVSPPTFLPVGRAIHLGNAGATGVRIAVVVHLFYFDLLDEICTYLRNIIEPFDLFITTPFEGDVAHIINRTHDLAQSVTIWFTENRGRDIGPFISLFRSGLLNSYLAVLKIHSKKSKYSDQGDQWRKMIYGELVGDSMTALKIISLFDSGATGLVGPHKFYLTHQNFWGANKDRVKRLLVCAGVLQANAEPELGFFAGSMFWFSPRAFAPINHIPVSELAFEPENGNQDGALAHSVERIFCQIVRAAGYSATSLQLSGANFSGAGTDAHEVPVL